MATRHRLYRQHNPEKTKHRYSPGQPIGCYSSMLLFFTFAFVGISDSSGRATVTACEGQGRVGAPYKRGTGLPNPSRETRFSGVKGDREIFIFPVQLTQGQDWQPYPVDLSLAICDYHTYTPT